MTGRDVLQKLLPTTLASAIVDTGTHEVGGLVVRAVDVVDRRTPRELLAAYGVDGDPEFVDVARFAVPPLARLGDPPTSVAPTRFLRGDGVVAVWELAPTRWSHGAEYWRIRSDGQQRVLSAYGGAAQGWRGAKGWQPPPLLAGAKGRWRGVELWADPRDDGVVLTALGPDDPGGWTRVRDGVFTALVPAAEVELFETVLTGRVHGAEVRVLASAAGWARVQLVGPDRDDPDVVRRVGAEPVEPGVFQARVPVAEVAGLHGVENVRA